MQTLITGASSNHFLTLKQCIGALIARYGAAIAAGRFRLVVWDVGLTDGERAYLEGLYKITLSVFDYERYPEHFNIAVAAGQYAWKPALIKETAERYGEGLYLWFDSGNITLKDLDPVYKYIGNHGLYSNKTDATVKVWTHPGVFDKIDPRYRLYAERSNRNGAIIGFDYSKVWVRELIETWASWAKNKEIIAPEGSSRANHRQDQSLFTLLFWDYQSRLHFDTTTTYPFIKIHNDVVESTAAASASGAVVPTKNA